MKKIALLLVYFGEWPIWFPAFLASCRHNASINWLIFTDIQAPPHVPANVSFLPLTLAQFNSMASKAIGIEFCLEEPYKLVDFKPAYGVIFEDYLREYDFWGHCDLDLVWGDLRSFITDDILRDHDIVSVRKNIMCGHFSLFRNTAKVANLFREHPKHLPMLTNKRGVGFDEAPISRVIAKRARSGELRVYWPEFVLGQEFARALRAFPTGWYWQNGKLYNGNDADAEIMYLHFMRWKKTLQAIDFNYDDVPECFEITRDCIRTIESR